MAQQSRIQFYRGLLAGMPALADGEPGWATDTFQLYVGDGTVNHLVTGGPGGVTSVATGVGLTGGPITTTGTVSLAAFSALTAATLADADIVPFYDVSASATRQCTAEKVRDYVSTFSNLGAGGPLADGDSLPYYDVSQGAPRYVTPVQLSAYLLPPGLMMAFGGSAAPSGWLDCNGAAVSRTTYAALFAALGVIWGAGDGSTTFNVPDLRGRTAIGVGTGSGLTARQAGDTGGTETHTLSEAELPLHDHNIRSANGTILFEIGDGALANIINSATFAGSATEYSSEDAGGGSSHANMQPWRAALWVIKT